MGNDEYTDIVECVLCPKYSGIFQQGEKKQTEIWTLLGAAGGRQQINGLLEDQKYYEEKP